MKHFVLLVLVLLVIPIGLGCSASKPSDAKFLMHEGFIKCYSPQLGFTDDSVIFEDGAKYHACIISVWRNNRFTRDINCCEMQQPYKLYYYSDGSYLLIPSSVSITETDCGCK